MTVVVPTAFNLKDSLASKLHNGLVLPTDADVVALCADAVRVFFGQHPPDRYY